MYQRGVAHPSRARQFMPFAALKGYDALVRQKQEIKEPRQPLTSEEVEQLDATLHSLKKGTFVECTLYKGGHYEKRVGVVTQVDAILHNLWVSGQCFPFETLCQVVVPESIN
jgi:hypothetical protein